MSPSAALIVLLAHLGARPHRWCSRCLQSVVSYAMAAAVPCAHPAHYDHQDTVELGLVALIV